MHTAQARHIIQADAHCTVTIQAQSASSAEGFKSMANVTEPWVPVAQMNRGEGDIKGGGAHLVDRCSPVRSRVPYAWRPQCLVQCRLHEVNQRDMGWQVSRAQVQQGSPRAATRDVTVTNLFSRFSARVSAHRTALLLLALLGHRLESNSPTYFGVCWSRVGYDEITIRASTWFLSTSSRGC